VIIGQVTDGLDVIASAGNDFKLTIRPADR
jgi:hypothetical protein